MSSGTHPKGSLGIVGSHAFSPITTKVYKDEKGVSTRLVHIRNPWGSERYSGPWSDNSAQMTERARKYLNNHQKNTRDGNFWVPVDLYKTLFATLS
jgi:hypothetical protein